MTLPSVEVLIADVPGAGQNPTSIATLYAIGYALRGGVDPVRVTSMNQLENSFGGRDPGSSLHDAASVFFREGGDEMVIQRLVGPDPVVATGVAQDSTPANTLRFNAVSAGNWANDLEAVIDATGSNFTVTIVDDGTTVQTSPVLANNAEAVAYFASSPYVRAVDLGGGDPVDATVSLSSGTDDRSNVTIDEIVAALDKFTADLGPGQVAAPGLTSEDVHTSLLAHAEANKRNALIDLVDTSTVADATSAAIALRGVDGNTLSAAFWPWDTAPGDSPGSTRTVPASARNAALFARAVRETGGEVGQPPAGGRYPARFVNGLSQLPITEADREALNDAGVNVSIERRGQVLTYGNRTLTSALSEPVWSQLNQSRVIAALASESAEIGGDYVHSKVDGQGLTLGEFAGRLQGLCADYFRRGDLYGATAEDAFTVSSEVEIDGADVTILGTIDATVSPGADKVRITIYKNPTA
jgi:phage tail sheath protein FI